MNTRISARRGLVAAFAHQTRVTRLAGTNLPLSMMLPPALRAVWAEGNPTNAQVNAALAELGAGIDGFKKRQDAAVQKLAAEVDNINIRLATGQLNGAGAAIGGRRRLTAEQTAEFQAALQGLPQAAVSTGRSSEGGFAVPAFIDTEIAAQLVEVSPMRSLAAVVTIETGDYEKLVNRRGAGAAWAGEYTTRDDDTDTALFGKVSIPTPELYACPQMTSWSLSDSSFDMESWLRTDVADELALAEGSAFVVGNGVEKPRGFTTVPTSTAPDASRPFGTVQYVPSGASGAFTATDPQDALQDLLTAVRPSYRQGPSVGWMMNSTTAGFVRKFKDGDGNSLWAASIQMGQPSQLLGFPVYECEDMPDLAANSLSVAFGNWSRFYTIADRRGMTLLVDPYTRKGWTKFYFSKRVGGQVVDSNAVKFLKFAAT